MRFVRFGPAGEERPGVLADDETILDIGPETLGTVIDLDDAILSDTTLPRVAVGSTRLGSPISRPRKIIGVGLNYAEHAAEAGVETPTEPVVFLKATSSL